VVVVEDAAGGVEDVEGLAAGRESDDEPQQQ
jgi:hypothetical protein